MNQLVLETTENMVSVYVMPVAWAKMRRIVETCSLEANWYGIVQRLNKYTFLIKDIYVAKQEVTGVSVDITPEDYMAFLRDLNTKGIIDLNDDEKGEIEGLYFQGHSHVNMGVGPSTIDEEDRRATIEKNVPFYIWIIMNKKGDHSCCVYINMVDSEGNNPLPMEGILFRNLQAQLYYDKPEEAMADIDRQIKENIHEKKPVFTTTTESSKISSVPESWEDYYNLDYYDSIGNKTIVTAEDGVPEIVDNTKTKKDNTKKKSDKFLSTKDLKQLYEWAADGKLKLYQVDKLYVEGLLKERSWRDLTELIHKQYDKSILSKEVKVKSQK